MKVFDVVPSTNDGILEAGARGEPEGTTHVARAQTRGRGRGGHAWWSPPGAGLWMSTLLRPTRPRDLWGGLALVAGVSLRRALERLGVKGVELFWPNDLLVARRKIGGILAEVRSTGDRAWMALGIGVNIDLASPGARASMPPELEGRVTSMAACGSPATLEPLEIAAVVLEALWDSYRRFESGATLQSLVEGSLAHVGRRVEVRVPGTTAWRGAVEGLGSRGELLIRVSPRGPCAGAAQTPGPPPPGALWCPDARRPGEALAALTGGEVLYEEDDRPPGDRLP